MLEVVEPTYLRRLIETLEQLVLALQHLTRAYYDDIFRPVVRVGILDDGYVRVRDTSASIDILEMLREFSWTQFNLSELNSLVSNLSNKLPPPQSLSDSLPNPTTTAVGSALLGWDPSASVWRRVAVDSQGRVRATLG